MMRRLLMEGQKGKRAYHGRKYTREKHPYLTGPSWLAAPYLQQYTYGTDESLSASDRGKKIPGNQPPSATSTEP